MTPNARVSATIQILDAILDGAPAEQALLRWSRASRFAGSGDRAAVRDLVFDTLRRRRSRAVRGGEMSGRGLVLGWLREDGRDEDAVFTGDGHDPAVLTSPERTGGKTPDDADLCDLPDWLIALFSASLTADFKAVATLSRDRAPVFLRVNTAVGTKADAQRLLGDDGIETIGTEHLSSALMVIKGARRVARSAAYTDGLVELQDLSPQMACATLPLEKDFSVLDFCAGGGGKALALAARGAARIVAHDIDPRRMADLPARAARAGAEIKIADQPSGTFDLVVADVPCSGSGTWRRAPDAKWRLTPQDLVDLTRLQGQILRQATSFVRPGGHLSYMTCSYLVDENETPVADFLADAPDFALISQQRFTPLSASDGFFLALIQRSQ